MFVENLTEETVTSAHQTYELFMRGSLNRHTGMTEMNRESSRSHSVFTVRRGVRRHTVPVVTTSSTTQCTGGGAHPVIHHV